MTRPFFSRDRISHSDIFERHANEAILLIKEQLRAKQAVDIQASDLIIQKEVGNHFIHYRMSCLVSPWTRQQSFCSETVFIR